MRTSHGSPIPASKLLFYLREHRVDVGLMIEIAIVGVLRELLINPPGTSLFEAAGLTTVLVALGALLIGNRLTERREFEPEGASTQSSSDSVPAQHRSTTTS